MKILQRFILGATLSTCPLLANAALVLVNGSALVDNTDSNTIWVNDGNLFFTQAQASGDPISFIQSVIAASNGIVADSPNEFDPSGTYQLGPIDFDASTGLLTWWGAQAWIHYLNSIDYQGYADWRLPTINDVRSNYFSSYSPINNGELAQLFDVELGGYSPANGDLLGTLDSNAAVFVNLKQGYWYGTESFAAAYGASGAWLFSNVNAYSPKKRFSHPSLYAFPVRSGQATALAQVESVNQSANAIGDGDKARGHAVAAKEFLQASCWEFKQYQKILQAPTKSNTTNSILVSDVLALEDLIGCK